MSNSQFEFLLNELRVVRDLGHRFHDRAKQAQGSIADIDMSGITEDQVEILLLVTEEIRRLS